MPQTMQKRYNKNKKHVSTQKYAYPDQDTYDVPLPEL
jgi:hypothetical protein